MGIHSTAFVVATALCLAALMSAPASLALEDDQIAPGAKRIDHVSRDDLKGACDRSGGSWVETADEYSCATDNSWAYCEKSSGDCVGGSQQRGKLANQQALDAQLSSLRATQDIKATEPPLRPPARPRRLEQEMEHGVSQ